MQDELSRRLQHCYTAIVHDVMRAMDMRDFTLPPDIRPIVSDVTIAGQAFTLTGRVDAAADPHETLLGWTGFLSRARPGSIVMCQANDSVVAHMGELSAETLKLKGVGGFVTDGGCRDVTLVRRQEFQVYCRYFTPRDVVGYWLPDAMGEPVTIGEVTIHDGDYVLADEDGVVVLPRARAAHIIAESETAMGTENQLRDAILDGMDPQQAYLKYGKF